MENKREKKYLIDNEKLMSEWDWAKNNELELNPNHLTCGSGKYAYWKCKLDHSWYAKIDNRNHGNMCPVCSGKIILAGFNDLATTHPNLITEWDFDKNTDIKPTEISHGSDKKVWWFCKNGHSWQSTVANRVNGKGCYECFKVKPRNREQYDKLRDKFSIKISQYDKDFNFIKEYNSITECSEELGISTGQLIDCCKRNIRTAYGFIFRYSNDNEDILTKTYKPFSFYGTSFPEQAILFYLKQIFSDTIGGYKDLKNGISEIDIFIPSLKIGIEYDGTAYHSNEDSYKRDNLKYKKCKSNNISLIRVHECDTHADCDIHIKSKYVDMSYEGLNSTIIEIIQVIFKSISKKSNIPTINSFVDKVKIQEQYLGNIKNKSLKHLFPEIASEWCYEENTPFKPENVFAYTHDKYWFKCKKCNNKYQMILSNRTRGKGCPKCGNKRKAEFNFKPCYQFSLEGEFIASYSSVLEAIEKYKSQSIYQALNNSTKTALNYIWLYENDVEKAKEISRSLNLDARRLSKTPVLQYTLDGVFIKQYENSGIAEKENNISHSKVGAVCRGKRKSAGGYIWKYIDNEKG